MLRAGGPPVGRRPGVNMIVLLRGRAGAPPSDGRPRRLREAIQEFRAGPRDDRGFERSLHAWQQVADLGRAVDGVLGVGLMAPSRQRIVKLGGLSRIDKRPELSVRQELPLPTRRVPRSSWRLRRIEVPSRPCAGPGLASTPSAPTLCVTISGLVVACAVSVLAGAKRKTMLRSLQSLERYTVGARVSRIDGRGLRRSPRTKARQCRTKGMKP